jgi:hypothetical protein
MIRVVRFLVALAIIQLTSVAGPIAYAHSDEVLARMTAPHGGVLKSLGPYHVEFVATTGRLTIYVTDHGGKRVDLGNSVVTITATTLASCRVVTLQRNAPGVFAGELDASSPDARGQFSVRGKELNVSVEFQTNTRSRVLTVARIIDPTW